MSGRVYYNENDPGAAAWLRDLVTQKVLPDGEIDTRSIVDVRPSDLRGFRQCHFFAGIGGWAYALQLAGWPADRECWTGSCPCQPWSVAGSGEGASDPRHLWPTWFPLIGERRPAALFGEQTASRDGEYWLDLVLSQMEGIDYAIGTLDLPVACVGAPGRRQRFWVVADDNRLRRSGLPAARLHADGQPGDHPLRRGADGVLADADGNGAGQHPRELSGDEGRHAKRPARRRHAPVAGGAARGVADAAGHPGPRGSSHEAGQGRAAQGRGEEQGGGLVQPGDDRPAVDVADAPGGRQRADGGAPRAPRHAHERRAARGVGDPHGGRQRAQRPRGARPEGGPGARPDAAGQLPPGAPGPGADGGLGDPGLERRPAGDGPTEGREAGHGADDAGRLGDPASEGLEGGTGLWAGGPGDEGRAVERAGPTHGFWFPCDWIPCIDGKARPVEPGTFPLAHGIPARVVRLRGYGNAINPWVAAEVIKAYMQIRGIR